MTEWLTYWFLLKHLLCQKHSINPLFRFTFGNASISDPVLYQHAILEHTISKCIVLDIRLAAKLQTCNLYLYNVRQLRSSCILHNIFKFYFYGCLYFSLVFQPLDNIYSIYTRGTSWNARHLENFSCLEPPTPPSPQVSSPQLNLFAFQYRNSNRWNQKQMKLCASHFQYTK